MKKLLILALCLALLAARACAEGAPEPTPEPSTKPSFDYDAIMADPDAHYGNLDYMRGTVARYDDLGQLFDAFEHSFSLLLSVDGEIGHTVLVYSGYNDGDDHPQKGDTIWVHGSCVGVKDIKSGLGLVLRFPTYVCREFQIFPRQ